MVRSWLACRLGLDGNPLRRRPDKIAACLAALLPAVFLIGASLLSMAAIGWAGRAGAAGLRAERSWRQAPAVLLSATPAAGMVLGHSRGPARLTAPGVLERTGQTPVNTALSAGRPIVPLWLAPAGSRARPRLNQRELLANEAAAALVVTVALGIALLSLA